MTPSRPVNLNLLTIKLPVAAIASILHRLSGVALFLFIPYALWLLYHSLHSEIDFVFLTLTLQKPLFKLLTWLWLTALGYHLLAGTRHILADFHLGTSKQGGARSAVFVIISAVILSLFIGYWVC
ncbi:MAG: succinate dehydrogenase, cytochrome b556 subunit [Gammaproteobacteria bacterium]|nr:succinate dehydrogenase, cytochrome b556 subunit [Gammaproteobacteria bacterium]